MWYLKHIVAPDLHVRQRLQHIEVCHKVATFECLIQWAENVERNGDDLYSCYPFVLHNDPEPVTITLRNARKTLAELMSDPDAGSVLSVLTFEITKLANAIAAWRGKSAPARCDCNSLIALTDLSDYEP